MSSPAIVMVQLGSALTEVPCLDEACCSSWCLSPCLSDTWPDAKHGAGWEHHDIPVNGLCRVITWQGSTLGSHVGYFSGIDVTQRLYKVALHHDVGLTAGHPTL